MNAMKLTLAALSLATLAQPALAAPGGRWHRPDHDSIRGGQTIDLGSIRMGDNHRRFDSDVLDIRRRPNVECNLTHIKFTAGNDNLRIIQVEVKYYNGMTDSIELDDDQDFGRGGPGRDFGRGRRNLRGIYLDKFRSSDWLNLSDVQDDRQSGRCIESIRVTGVDVPDRGFDRHDRRLDRPATVRVEGLLAMRRPGPGRPDWNNPPRPPMPPREHAVHIGRVKFSLNPFKDDNEAFNNNNVPTPVRTIIIEGDAYLKEIQVICETGAVCYSERPKEMVKYKRINLPRPMVVKTIKAAGRTGELNISVIR